MAELVETHKLTPEVLAKRGTMDREQIYNAREIKLTRGEVALVDAEDFDRINGWSWFCNVGMQKRAVRTRYGRMIYMHHEVLEVDSAELSNKGLEVDHIDRNPLNNTKQNLRIVTHRENCQNTVIRDKFRGIVFHKASGLWFAYMKFGRGDQVSLGYWRTKERALEIVTLGLDLKDKFPDEIAFRREWKKIRPRKPYEKSKM